MIEFNRVPFGTALRIVVVSIALSLLYLMLDGNEWTDPAAWLNALTLGLLAGLFIVFFELAIDHSSNRNMRLIPTVVFKSLVYTLYFALLIPIVIAFWRSWFEEKGFIGYLTTDFVTDYVNTSQYSIMLVYTLFLCSAVMFTHQISLKMGPGVLWKFITGKYHRAREEDRIFMFLDLNNSTAIAEKLGPIEFNKLLNVFFFHITKSIRNNRGEIYRYVGDEVVVSWPVSKGIKNASCIRTFFEAKNAIRKQREYYLNNFGFLPEFTAAFHLGTVIVGEIGDVKSQISFSGRVLYSTAAIEKLCRSYQSEVLVTERLLDKIDLPRIYQKNPAASWRTDSGTELALFSLNEVSLI